MTQQSKASHDVELERKDDISGDSPIIDTDSPDIRGENLQSIACSLNAGRRVLEIEGRALLNVAETLDASFTQAVRLLSKTRERIIVSGMGKSGHVARKIAATLASTGSPSYFVHPAEASHGDLGMISPRDVIILLSNSGKTQELSAIISYAKRYSIPIVSISKDPQSILSKSATVPLIVSGEEACPLGLAPTTSTTLMMALGDALAVALLEMKKFKPDDFKVFHPGGNLGGQLTPVSDIMHTRNILPIVDENAPMGHVIATMSEKKFGCTGVVDENGVLTGIVTDGDLRRHMCNGIMDQSVTDIMTKNPRTIARDAYLPETLALMEKHAITSLFVLDEKKRPEGLIHIHDMLRNGVA